eukprot:scaffold296121_cov36-Tisochrysis_lutea.AAC.1
MALCQIIQYAGCELTGPVRRISSHLPAERVIQSFFHVHSTLDVRPPQRRKSASASLPGHDASSYIY